jgi:hypothetical protein
MERLGQSPKGRESLPAMMRTLRRVLPEKRSRMPRPHSGFETKIDPFMADEMHDRTRILTSRRRVLGLDYLKRMPNHRQQQYHLQSETKTRGRRLTLPWTKERRRLRTSLPKSKRNAARPVHRNLANRDGSRCRIHHPCSSARRFRILLQVGEEAAVAVVEEPTAMVAEPRTASMGPLWQTEILLILHHYRTVIQQGEADLMVPFAIRLQAKPREQAALGHPHAETTGLHQRLATIPRSLP